VVLTGQAARLQADYANPSLPEPKPYTNQPLAAGALRISSASGFGFASRRAYKCWLDAERRNGSTYYEALRTWERGGRRGVT
jgi:hypothetical protein